MTRIKLEDSMNSIIMKMSDSNPGAMSVMLSLIKNSDKIDTDNMMGGLGHILDLDSMGIYADRIWMLFSDICDQNLVLFVAVLRAWQLGKLSIAEINSAIDRDAKIDIAYVLRFVRDELAGFTREDTIA